MLGDDANEELLKKIDFYHYEVQSKSSEILNGLIEKNIPVMVVSATNIQRTPLVETWHNDSDGTVDTKYSSVGATVANLWETLGDSYVQAIDDGHNHLSPDNRIDASTCAFPDSLYYEKILAWNTNTYFNKQERIQVDTTFNDWYTEYPFFHEDVNATYLGVIGSASQNFNWFKRRDLDVAPFYAPYLPYTYTGVDDHAWQRLPALSNALAPSSVSHTALVFASSIT